MKDRRCRLPFGLLATLAFADFVFTSGEAFAHGTERGLVMLLPTDYYLIGGAIAVAASFAILLLIPARVFECATNAVIVFSDLRFPPPTATSIVSTGLLFLLLATGIASTSDPLENPLPLFVWTFFWVGFTLLQAVFGNLWPWFNPWTGPLAVLRKLTGRPLGITPIMTMPARLGYAPAIILFLLFAWYELVSLAPEDPSQLAHVVSVYWLFTLCAMAIFGEKEWSKRAEPFSVYFHMIGMLAPLSAAPANEEKKGNTVYLSWPGQRCLDVAGPPISGALFLLLTLGTASFDGFSETFTWLAAVGVNPLEFPGRSAVTLSNSFGLIAAPLVLASLYLAAVMAGGWAAGERSPSAVLRLSCHLVYSIVPISIAFHAAHYLTLILINSQYLYAVISDPFALGWDLFGTAHWHVTASFLTSIDSVQIIWIVQTLIIVLGHCVGILLAHMIALRHFGDSHRATVSQIFLAMVMVFYTVFGLWLLSTPTVG